MMNGLDCTEGYQVTTDKYRRWWTGQGKHSPHRFVAAGIGERAGVHQLWIILNSGFGQGLPVARQTVTRRCIGKGRVADVADAAMAEFKQMPDGSIRTLCIIYINTRNIGKISRAVKHNRRAFL